jgi:hypothetical protein
VREPVDPSKLPSRSTRVLLCLFYRRIIDPSVEIVQGKAYEVIISTTAGPDVVAVSHKHTARAQANVFVASVPPSSPSFESSWASTRLLFWMLSMKNSGLPLKRLRLVMH